MNYIVKITGIALGLVVMFAFATPEKKMDKLAGKVWKDQNVELQSMELPDTLKTDITAISEVKADGVTVGYACYTTAFGCRVGGCAAPTNPNVQSYETFDYIVIYDTDLNIKKVDIANYGGQYGYEICRPKWLKQFVGSNSGFKLDENIDGISGATVSAQFLIDDLNEVGKMMKNLDLQKVSASTN